jgi:hypothetical protein
MILFSVPSFAQTIERRPTNPTPQAEEQLPVLPPNAASLEIVANEIGLLRKSLQALNIRLRDIGENVAPRCKSKRRAERQTKSHFA